MTVSLVGRMAMGRSRSLCPALVTHATCTCLLEFTNVHKAVTQHKSHHKQKSLPATSRMCQGLSCGRHQTQ